MKRGFFNSSSAGKSASKATVTHRPLPPSTCLASTAALPSNSTPEEDEDVQYEQPLIHMKADYTIVEEISPLILLADHRMDASPYFGYFPPKNEEPEMVIICQDMETLEEIASWKIWSEPACVNLSPAERAFTVRGQPGKGMAMFASRDIKMGELIHRERPISVTVQNYNVAPDQGPATGDFYRSALSRLARPEQQAILALSNCMEKTVDVVAGIMHTNALPVDLQTQPDPNVKYCGIFPTLSRANHSCAPNTNYFFQFADFTGRYYASRDIKAGEEITIMYCELLQSQEARRESLYRSHRFVCHCDFCSTPPSSIQTKKSDENRTFIRDTVAILGAGDAAAVPIADIHKGILICDQEALVTYKAQLLYLGGASLLHRDKVHAAEAVRWLHQAKRLYEALEGKESYHVVELRDSLDD